MSAKHQISRASCSTGKSRLHAQVQDRGQTLLIKSDRVAARWQFTDGRPFCGADTV